MAVQNQYSGCCECCVPCVCSGGGSNCYRVACDSPILYLSFTNMLIQTYGNRGIDTVTCLSPNGQVSYFSGGVGGPPAFGPIALYRNALCNLNAPAGLGACIWCSSGITFSGTGGTDVLLAGGNPGGCFDHYEEYFTFSCGCASGLPNINCATHDCSQVFGVLRVVFTKALGPPNDLGSSYCALNSDSNCFPFSTSAGSLQNVGLWATGDSCWQFVGGAWIPAACYDPCITGPIPPPPETKNCTEITFSGIKAFLPLPQVKSNADNCCTFPPFPIGNLPTWASFYAQAHITS